MDLPWQRCDVTVRSMMIDKREGTVHSAEKHRYSEGSVEVLYHGMREWSRDSKTHLLVWSRAVCRAFTVMSIMLAFMDPPKSMAPTLAADDSKRKTRRRNQTWITFPSYLMLPFRTRLMSKIPDSDIAQSIASDARIARSIIRLGDVCKGDETKPLSQMNTAYQ
ncbi:hypothetical protein GYMLUDRAFT_472304 [Collybiopsis luxurians FD-317 M1]|uniref:Uncharacterized protein n=1 Tax=Collybiopsis luxurians FD-317 M1 TaxID=944289 RepID=A0A0D0CTZ6_9AGAR|nr:hypothetical protein GYMLUDRAFT_472304 [Collybiopsis luxurians FD-317 M1]